MQQVHVITGATSGIGRVTAEALAASGAEVVLVARDQARGEQAVAEIRDATGNLDVSLALADLASQAQVRHLADELHKRVDRIDVLVNNAGLVMRERQLTEDGREMTLAVNHLAPFLLTNLVLDLLRRAPAPRVVTTASVAEKGGELDPDDLDLERRGFRPFRAYCQSKLANVLFTAELARRHGSRLHATCVHPGGVSTNFGTQGPWLLQMGLKLGGRLTLRSPQRGADTLTWAALDDTAGPGVVPNGCYLADRAVKRPSAQARNAQLASRLWEVSTELVGLTATDL